MSNDKINIIDPNWTKLLSVAIGMVYIWFGALKFFPNLSPAEELASITISTITFGALAGRSALVILAIWELLVGVTFVFNYHRKWNVALGLIHILGTFLPFFLLSSLCFSDHVGQFTLVGQYIFKNVLFLTVMLAFWYQIKKKENE